MTKVDILSLIHLRYNSFTNTEKKVADYILENIKNVIYMSITDLADACNVGESSVFRFCKTLKLRGYQEFKIALAHSTSSEDEMPQFTSKVTMQDTIGELSSKMYAATVNALAETQNLVNSNDVSNAVDMLINGKRIHFFGVGGSLMTALEANNKFMRITNKTECTIDSHLQIISASLMGEDEVAVLISYLGSMKDLVQVAKAAEGRGAKIILITRFAKSPLANYADVILLCGANEGPLQAGSLSAKVSQLYLLELLYAEYFKRTNRESSINNEITANAEIEKMM